MRILSVGIVRTSEDSCNNAPRQRHVRGYARLAYFRLLALEYEAPSVGSN